MVLKARGRVDRVSKLYFYAVLWCIVFVQQKFGLWIIELVQAGSNIPGQGEFRCLDAVFPCNGNSTIESCVPVEEDRYIAAMFSRY